jgi:lipopolysaccharide exporter
MIKKIKLLVKSEGLLGRSLLGSGWLGFGTFIDHFGRFLRNIILTRLLAPETFGLMATLIAAVSALEAIAEVGLGQSIIRNKDGAKYEFLNIVWWMSAVRGLLLYLIAIIAAPFISHIYHKPEATELLRIGFTVFLFSGLMSPGVFALAKELRFKRWVALMQGAGLIGVIVAVILGFIMKNVWALVIAFIVEGFLRFVLSFMVCPFKPVLKFEIRYVHEVLRFSKGLFGLPLLMMIYFQTDIFVVGKILSLAILGKYTLAKTIAEIPTAFLGKIVNPVLMSALSAMQDNLDKFFATLMKMMQVLTMFISPVIAFFIVCSGPILTFFYGKNYTEMAVPLSVLSVSYLITMLTGLIMEAYFALGKPDLHRNSALARTFVIVILIYPLTVTFGAFGAALAIVIAIATSLFVQFYYVNKLYGVAPSQFIMHLIPGLKYSLIVFIPGLSLKYFGKLQGREMLISGIALCIIAWVVIIISIRPLLDGLIRLKTQKAIVL